jgi:23S rRNA (adenine2503-C2)-methyltransferase
MLDLMKVIDVVSDGDVTKFVSSLDDEARIESVLIPAPGRTTLCVSCQVGCRMGCLFCATGRMGFVRDLTPVEIVWQFHAARAHLHGEVDNLVFMGMGEPFDNLASVMEAVRVMSDQRGLDIATSHITLSTAGHADGIRALAAMPPPRPRLALSLHTADNALRNRLVPLNRRYPLARLKDALLAFPLGSRGLFLVEYVLLSNLNDSQDDALRLARYLDGLPVRINLIAYNPCDGMAFSAPPVERVHSFRNWLTGEGLFVRVRPARGTGIMAACGQLGAVRSAVSARNPPSLLP